MSEPTQEMANEEYSMLPPQLPLYTCHKQVRAARIIWAEERPNTPPNDVVLEFLDESGMTGKLVDGEWLIRRTDTKTIREAIDKCVGGYYIEYEDNYTSWSPAEAFEAGYHLGDDTLTHVGAAVLEVASAQEIDDMVTPITRELVGFDIREHNAIQVFALGDAGVGGGHSVYAMYARDSTTPLSLINFQNGPIGEEGVNGISHEALIAVLLDRLQSFQDGKYRCTENSNAQHFLHLALEELHARTRKRMDRGHFAERGTNE